MEILTNLTGVSFRPSEAKEVVKQLSIGDSLRLERDPNNKFDSNAVMVMAEVGAADQGDVHLEFIGFIPAADNAEIAEHLDEGGEYTCTVVSFLGTLKPGLKVVLE